MKLYYSPGACSLASHIALKEAGLNAAYEAVNLHDKTYSGGDFKRINAKGYVPTLELDDGTLLTEGVAILTYIAAQKPEAKLLPAVGSNAYFRGLEWLTFIATELHKNFAPLFKGGTPEAKDAAKAKLEERFGFVAKALKTNPYLLGADFSVADAYLYVTTGWARKAHVDLSRMPELLGFHERVGTRPAVQAALKEETTSSK